jgi:uncharacterized protein YjiK
MPKFIKYCASLILLVSVLLLHSKCNINRQEPPERHKLLLKNSFTLSVPEPSGLSFTYDKSNLWTVSDQDSTIYLISKKGKTLKSFKVDLEDLEGIAVIDINKIAVIGERAREIVILDTNGTALQRTKLDLMGRLNEGIEGICYNVKSNNFFLVNEKRPGLLIITDADFKVKSKTEIKFAKDYSGLSYDLNDNSIWVLSDESKRFFKISEDGTVLNEFQIFIEQPEGLAVDVDNKKVFIVSDKTEKLYEYDLP